MLYENEKKRREKLYAFDLTESDHLICSITGHFMKQKENSWWNKNGTADDEAAHQFANDD